MRWEGDGAMTMGTVATEFQWGWDEVRQLAREEEQVEVLVQQIALKFGQRTAEEARQSIVGSPGRDRVAWVTAAILDCDTPEDLLARLQGN